MALQTVQQSIDEWLAYTDAVNAKCATYEAIRVLLSALFLTGRLTHDGYIARSRRLADRLDHETKLLATQAPPRVTRLTRFMRKA